MSTPRSSDVVASCGDGGDEELDVALQVATGVPTTVPPTIPGGLDAGWRRVDVPAGDAD